FLSSWRMRITSVGTFFLELSIHFVDDHLAVTLVLSHSSSFTYCFSLGICYYRSSLTSLCFPFPGTIWILSYMIHFSTHRNSVKISTRRVRRLPLKTFNFYFRIALVSFVFPQQGTRVPETQA